MIPSEPRYRFLRVLEYIGTVERLTEARERRQVKGTAHFGKDLSIFEGVLGDACSPVTGQIRLRLCQMIVRADEEMPINPSMYTPDFIKGYEEACQELLALIEFNPTLEKSHV
jgi:hypothetical protein